MNNEALYYARPDLEGLDARLVSVVGEAAEPGLVFDESIFYPEGGGQPCDLGSIGGIPLLSVRDEAGSVVHRLAAPLPSGFEPGQVLPMRLDMARRRDHSEQHSGQHLLSATLLKLFDAPTRSFHLGPEQCTIDIDRPALGLDELDAVETAVNRAISDNHAIRTHLCPPEDPSAFPLRRLPPAGESVLRIVEIEGIDFTPCCGTHAGGTRDLRLLLLLGAERYKGMSRVHFIVGERAIKAARAAMSGAREAGRILGCGSETLGDEVARQTERLKTALAGQRALLRARAALEADAAIKGGGSGPIVQSYPDRDADAAVEAVKALAERGRMALVASLTDLTVCAAAPGDRAGLGSRLKPLCEAAGGKGGGSGGFFRASFPNLAYLNDFMANARDNLPN